MAMRLAVEFGPMLRTEQTVGLPLGRVF